MSPLFVLSGLFWIYLSLVILYAYLSQLQWYVEFGTRFDTVPWLFQWMTKDAFVITPNVVTTGGATSFTPEQIAFIRNLLLFEFFIFYLIFLQQNSTFVANEPLAANSISSSGNVSDDMVTAGSERIVMNRKSSGDGSRRKSKSSTSNNRQKLAQQKSKFFEERDEELSEIDADEIYSTSSNLNENEFGMTV